MACEEPTLVWRSARLHATPRLPAVHTRSTLLFCCCPSSPCTVQGFPCAQGAWSGGWEGRRGAAPATAALPRCSSLLLRLPRPVMHTPAQLVSFIGALMPFVYTGVALASILASFFPYLYRPACLQPRGMCRFLRLTCCRAAFAAHLAQASQSPVPPLQCRRMAALLRLTTAWFARAARWERP